MHNLGPGLGSHHGAYNQSFDSIWSSDSAAATVLVGLGRLVVLLPLSLWEPAGTKLPTTDREIKGAPRDAHVSEVTAQTDT
jgi:hypothetical protein